MSTLTFEPKKIIRTNRPPQPVVKRNPIIVERVTTARQRKEFVEFPYQLYADDPQWCPPLRSEVYAFIDRTKHPFYKHGTAALFLARRNGQVVGRILVSDDPHYNQEHETNCGCFGMFETIDNPSVAQSLLNAAARWLRIRGRTSMMGPIDYSTNYPSGLLIEGFDTPQRIMMNHNPRYYEKLLENCGLKKAKDMYAWWFDGENASLDDWVKRAERIAKRGGVTVRPVRFSDFNAEVARCMQVYNTTWEKTWGFVKMTPEEFKAMAQQFKRIGMPELLLLAEVEGQPVGFCVTMPDLYEAIRPLNGKLTTWGLPIGLFKFLWNRKRIRTARMAVLGVLPGYRKRGVAELMILRAFQFGKQKLGYTGAELGWTLEDNEMINRTVESVGAKRYKKFRIYERAI